MSKAAARVGDISQQLRGVSYSKDDARSAPESGFVPILRAGNIADSGLTFDDLVFVPEKHVANKQRLRAGDVLIAASSGSLEVVGKAAPALFDYEGAFGAFCKVLRPNRDVVAPNYFAHFFKTDRYRQTVSRLAEGANINNLKSEHLNELTLPLPSLPEQRRIAAILDLADTIRAKRRAALAQLDRLAQAIFIDMFGDPLTNPKAWPEATVGDVGDVQGGLQLSGSRSSLPLEVPYLRVANVYRDRLDLNGIKTFRLTPAELARTRLIAGDILIVEGHGNPEEIGRCAVWDGGIAECSHQNHLIRLRVNKNKAHPRFVASYLNSVTGRRGLQNASNTTSGLNTISVGKVKACRILVPPLDLQSKFATCLGGITALRQSMLRAIEQDTTLAKSLQYRAFSGSL